MRKDIDLSFNRHPLTGDLAVKSGSSAVRQSLINIIRTNYYDRGFNVDLGTNIDASLFESNSVLTNRTLHENITNAINNFEPQVELSAVNVINDGENELTVKIYYTELNNPNEQSLIIDLIRVR